MAGFFSQPDVWGNKKKRSEDFHKKNKPKAKPKNKAKGKTVKKKAKKR